MDNCLFSVGFIIPKRYARRSVTRNLIRRQMRAAVQRHQAAFRSPIGAKWVLRLRAAFAIETFPSAASQALKSSVRSELDALLAGSKR